VTAPASEILVNPRAYQQTHALTELAVGKVDKFGEHLTEACVRLEDLERDNKAVWRHVNSLKAQFDAEKKVNALRLQYAQRATALSFTCACLAVGMAIVMVILWGMK
jgi:ferric-dicitrate binding protein FerR (iron transport regulator)